MGYLTTSSVLWFCSNRCLDHGIPGKQSLGAQIQKRLKQRDWKYWGTKPICKVETLLSCVKREKKEIANGNLCITGISGDIQR
jgi:hypothetical protein